MGAGVLPATILNGKVHFLFGKENQYEDSAHGFSDFGGGTDNRESYLETAVREAGEEFTGFLGSDTDVRQMLKRHGTFDINYKSDNQKFGLYRMHIFPFPFNPYLTQYYNNNQRFLQKHLDPAVIKKTKIFEKAEIKWVCIDDLKRMRPQFRSYFQNIVDLMLARRAEIERFLRRGLHSSSGKLRTTTTSRRGYQRTNRRRKTFKRTVRRSRSRRLSS